MTRKIRRKEQNTKPWNATDFQWVIPNVCEIKKKLDVGASRRTHEWQQIHTHTHTQTHARTRNWKLKLNILLWENMLIFGYKLLIKATDFYVDTAIKYFNQTFQ